MFILNNIRDRKYKTLYKSRSSSEPVFDMSSDQIKSKKNEDWHQLGTGDLISVITSSRNLSLIYQVSSVEQATREDALDPEVEGQHVVWATPVARFKHSRSSSSESMLNKYGVRHARLPSNKFSVGFNIANLQNQLDQAEIKGAKGAAYATLGELRSQLEM